MVKSKPKPTSPFDGRWRFVSISAYEQDFIDEMEEGYIVFADKDQGQFRFGYVHGQMDCGMTMSDGESAVEWTGTAMMKWTRTGLRTGHREGDILHTMIFFHQSDESESVVREKGPSGAKSKR